VTVPATVPRSCSGRSQVRFAEEFNVFDGQRATVTDWNVWRQRT